MRSGRWRRAGGTHQPPTGGSSAGRLHREIAAITYYYYDRGVGGGGWARRRAYRGTPHTAELPHIERQLWWAPATREESVNFHIQ